MTQYTARLTRGGPSSWVVEFRHPLLKDPRDERYGRKVRRGLGLDETEAQRIVDGLNTLLGDEAYWSLTQQPVALRQFPERAVAIFYDQVEAELLADPWDVREQTLPLPGAAQGYARVLLLGAPGSGKTTLIRQLIGADPTNQGFPATSSQRTTTFPTEFILTQTPQSQVIVTFLSQAQVVRLIEECVVASVQDSCAGRERKQSADSLLEHAEQRFRLYQILGRYRPPTSASGEQEVDQSSLFAELQVVLDAIDEIAHEVQDDVPPMENESRDAHEERQESWIREESARFNELVVHILDTIKSRFAFIPVGTIQRDPRGWPQTWTYETQDVADLLHQMERFAGNDWHHYGRLLTPLVSGARLSAPFRPHWWALPVAPHLVLIDGEGIGHGSSIMTALPIELTGRFNDVEAIVLVDDAVKAMQQTPQIILRDVAWRGMAERLLVIFTHCEQLEGANIQDDRDRIDMAASNLYRAMDRMGESLHPALLRRLSDHLDEHHVFFVQQLPELNPVPTGLAERLTSFVAMCERLGESERQPLVMPFPFYEYSRLGIVLNEASQRFMEKWLGLLGLAPSSFPVQHWTRIKALSRRVAHWENVVRYSDLDPAGDMVSYLMQYLHAFLSEPQAWPPALTESQQQQIVDTVAGTIAGRLNVAIVERLKLGWRQRWVAAYNEHGDGSVRRRARIIEEIYTGTMPHLSADVHRDEDAVLDVVRAALDELSRESASGGIPGVSA